MLQHRFTPPAKLKALVEESKHPPLPLVADFIHQCSPDPAVRTNIVTQLVLSTWQLAGGKASPSLPSLLTITPSPDSLGSERDFADQIFNDPPREESAQEKFEQELTISRAERKIYWSDLSNIKAQLDKQSGKPTQNAHNDNLHWNVRRATLRHGPCQNYANAWHPDFNLVTERNNEAILWLENKSDRDALRKDVLHRPDRLTYPTGYTQRMASTSKRIALSGTIPVSEWDHDFAMALVDLGLPLLTLPGLSDAPPKIARIGELRRIAHIAARQQTPILEEPSHFVKSPWSETFAAELRNRLHHLPAAYEFSINKMSRQLILICFNIAHFWGKISGSTFEEIQALTHDLNQYTLRGILLSLATLSWHGLGIDSGVPHDTTIRVLSYLRSRSPISKSDLLRGAHLKKDERDRILACLEKENLITIEDKTVSANSFADFTKALHSQPDFPLPENRWKNVTKREAAIPKSQSQ